jgi:membrane glycosyltransferase
MFCHDQIESILMHRAGYEIRELPVGHGSYEGVPPMLADFTTRYCRWLQGNLKNLRLLRLHGLTAMDRYHIISVAHRFMAWPAVILFVALALPVTVRWPLSSAFAAGSAVWLYVGYLAIYFTPKILGLVDSAMSAPGSYGGVKRLVAGGAIDFVLTFLFLPIAMLTATFCVVGLIFGRMLTWDTQQREGYRLSWSAAAKTLWPHTMVGLALLATLTVAAPAAIPWFLPFFAGLVLAIPLAVLTASAELGRLAASGRLCVLPEDIEVPHEIASVLAFEAASGKPFPDQDHFLNASGSIV